MPELQKVKVFKSERQIEDGKLVWKTVFDYTGKFHGWGVDNEEGETGYGNYTCGIVEKIDGTISLVYAGHIQFI